MRQVLGSIVLGLVITLTNITSGGCQTLPDSLVVYSKGMIESDGNESTYLKMSVDLCFNFQTDTMVMRWGKDVVSGGLIIQVDSLPQYQTWTIITQDFQTDPLSDSAMFHGWSISPDKVEVWMNTTGDGWEVYRTFVKAKTVTYMR